jgi:hypothetical protein
MTHPDGNHTLEDGEDGDSNATVVRIWPGLRFSGTVFFRSFYLVGSLEGGDRTGLAGWMDCWMDR